MPKASIVTPSYNHAPFLRDRVNSILNQTFDDFEWIIIDDCSTDNSAEILRNLTAHDPRVKLLFNDKNLGMAATTKKAIELCSGEFIYRAESDDSCHPKFLERMVAALDTNPNAGFVFCRSLHIDRKGKLWGGWNQGKQDYVRPGLDIFRTLVLRNYIPGCNIVFSRKAGEAVGGFGKEPFSVACDWHFCLRLSLHYDVAYLAEPLGYHRIHDTNLSGNLGRTFDLTLFFREGYELLQDVFASIPENQHKLHHLRAKAFKNLSLRHGASLYIKAVLNAKWRLARQIVHGIEHYDPGATRSLDWIRACAGQLLLSGVYHHFYMTLGRIFSIRGKYRLNRTDQLVSRSVPTGMAS